MKALTVSQPFASMIADGEKRVENRIWSTNYRGPLAIHAGTGSQYLAPRQLGLYPMGCVVATCELIACVERIVVRRFQETPHAIPDFRDLAWTEEDVTGLLDDKHTEGPWLWVLANVRKLSEPVSATGKRGLWEWVE